MLQLLLLRLLLLLLPPPPLFASDVRLMSSL